MSLHLVYSSTGWEACRMRMQPDDAVVLIGDGVYVARADVERKGADPVSLNQAVYALEEDLTVRGVLPGAAINAVDYAAFVALCVDHHPLVSWQD